MYSAAFIWEPGTYDAEFHRLSAIKALSTHPVHQQAKREYARWYAGYHIVVSQVLRSYGDGAFEHVMPNARAG
ncbi:MAG TPA: hypothetical protein VHF86_05360 [Xanthomonadaceae bacterium]|nr:hypothetical protein [Xanthomonadaceae bacterium]